MLFCFRLTLARHACSSKGVSFGRGPLQRLSFFWHVFRCTAPAFETFPCSLTMFERSLNDFLAQNFPIFLLCLVRQNWCGFGRRSANYATVAAANQQREMKHMVNRLRIVIENIILGMKFWIPGLLYPWVPQSKDAMPCLLVPGPWFSGPWRLIPWYLAWGLGSLGRNPSFLFLDSKLVVLNVWALIPGLSFLVTNLWFRFWPLGGHLQISESILGHWPLVLSLWFLVLCPSLWAVVVRLSTRLLTKLLTNLFTKSSTNKTKLFTKSSTKLFTKSSTKQNKIAHQIVHQILHQVFHQIHLKDFKGKIQLFWKFVQSFGSYLETFFGTLFGDILRCDGAFGCQFGERFREQFREQFRLWFRDRCL